MKKKKSLEVIESYISRRPEEFVDLMYLMAGATEKFVEREKKKRFKVVSNAIKLLLKIVLNTDDFYELTSRQRVQLLLDLCFYLFPDGKNNVQSKDEIRLYNIFITECTKESVLFNPKWAEWVLSRRGEDYWDWLEKTLTNG